ncbi:MAG: hypothetical protein Q7T41_01235, partial [Candidatus Saccharibacteria bacterium]|nr:hypothetical protein [Candidatus Saccharibacteria bacterium]
IAPLQINLPGNSELLSTRQLAGADRGSKPISSATKKNLPLVDSHLLAGETGIVWNQIKLELLNMWHITNA